jgi:lysozyme family protein
LPFAFTGVNSQQAVSITMFTMSLRSGNSVAGRSSAVPADPCSTSGGPYHFDSYDLLRFWTLRSIAIA